MFVDQLHGTFQFMEAVDSQKQTTASSATAPAAAWIFAFIAISYDLNSMLYIIA